LITDKEAFEIVSRHKGVFTSPPTFVPSEKVTDGILLGNGDIGVVISGEPSLQRFWLSKNDFWKAKRIFPNASPCLMGGIDVSIPDMKAASYYSEQQLYEAQAVSIFSTPQTKVTIKSWVAATDHVLVINFSCIGRSVPVKLDLWAKTGHESSVDQGMDDSVIWVTRKFNSDDLDWHTEASVAMRCLTENNNEFVLEQGNTVTLVACFITNHDSEDYFPHSCQTVKEINENVVQDLRSRHDNWWKDFWRKSLIEIDDKMIEKFWYGSHYIMASCSRNKQFPPGLFGNWITTDNPGWAGDYHLNYNYQAAWWGAYSSNHIELTEPYDTPLIQYMPNGRENAQNFLGTRGIYYEVGIGPKGLPTVLTETPYEAGHLFLGQKSNATYCAVNMLMRFDYTYDLHYGKEIVYPFLIELANFWEDYLRFEENRYIDYKDAIHEVETWTEFHTDEEWARGFEDKNPILSLALIRRLFNGLLILSEELGMDEERRDKWLHITLNISEYPTMEKEGKTVFRLTEQGLDWFESNTLEIQHIWPAGGITLSSDPELLTIARDTITILNRWNDYNGFPTIFTAAVRVGYDPEVVLVNLRKQCMENSFANLFIFFGGGGIECCSAVPTAINEMLLQTHEGIIQLFPVWPKRRDARFKSLRAVGAFLVSSEQLDGVVTFIEIESEKGRICKVFNPWSAHSCVVKEITDNQEVIIPSILEGRILTFNTKVGRIYKIVR
jgi:hypothetical protein